MLKKIYLLIVFAGFLFAQDPSISFDKTNHNFGDVKEGKFVICDYLIKNTGKSDLIISKVKASCGCTAARPKKNTLKPGEETTLKVEFNTYRREGRQKKFIYVFSNDPKQKQVRLSFTANVIKKTLDEMKNEKVALLKIEKNYFDLGKIKQGEKRKIKIPVKNIGSEPLKILSIKSTCSCIAAEANAKFVQPGEESFVDVEVDTADYIGKMSRTITIICNDPYNSYQAVSIYMSIVK